jgi:hypothetical protein
MDEAPERIWAFTGHKSFGHEDGIWTTDEPGDDEGFLKVQYVRADLLEAQAAQLQEARAVLRIIAGYEQCVDNLMSNADIARAFLAK